MVALDAATAQGLTCGLLYARLRRRANRGNDAALVELVLDAQGKPHITYQDGYNGDLRYAHLLAGDHFLYLPLVSGQ